MAQTTLPSDLSTHVDNMCNITGLKRGSEVGSLPDPTHKSGGGYHCGVQDIKDIGKYPDKDYSTRQSRDRVGGNACSAEDVGDNWPKGGRAAWLRFNNWLVQAMRSGDPDLLALRAVNFSPDGTACKRYDSFNPSAGIIASTDSVYMHTHLEWWRNTAGTEARARSMRKIESIASAAIANNKELVSMADTSGWTTPLAQGTWAAPYDKATALAFTWETVNAILDIVKKLGQVNPDIDNAELDAIEARVKKALAESQGSLVNAILAALPESQVESGDGSPAYTVEDVEQALRNVFADAAAK